MTFKHNKFSDSAVMRSFEKVAVNKGLVKVDPVVKTASKKTDFNPTSNLTENILKLCSGLRMHGMNKYAEELEGNLLNYKKAQNLYDVTKETGEDVVEFAHPKGSHKLEDVDSSEAVFEDILDRHEKIKKVVDKKPTGKLETSAQVINAVLIALGEEEVTEQERENLAKQFASAAKQAIDNAKATNNKINIDESIKENCNTHLSIALSAVDKILNGKLESSVANEGLISLDKAKNSLYTEAFTYDEEKLNINKKIKPIIDVAINRLWDVKKSLQGDPAYDKMVVEKRKEKPATVTSTETRPATDPNAVENKAKELLGRVDEIVKNPKAVAQLENWPKEQKDSVNKLLSDYKEYLSLAQEGGTLKEYNDSALKKLSAEEKDISQIEQWARTLK